MKNAILTVTGKDRPGIIAKVTEVLFKNGCNLEDVSMTILEGEFAMMLILKYLPAKIKQITRHLDESAKKWHLSVSVKPFQGVPKRGEKHLSNSRAYLVTAMGKDKTGIVYKVSSLLAKQGLNITDLNCRILGKGKRAIYLMMLEVDFPVSVNESRIKQALDQLAHSLDIEISLKSAERVTL